MILWHLDNIELLLCNTNNPELPEEVAMTDLEVVPRGPCLRSIAERADNAKAIEAEQLAFLAEPEPAKFASWCHRTVSVQDNRVLARCHV